MESISMTERKWAETDKYTVGTDPTVYIGLHSISDIDDPNCWTEIRANRFAKKYFGEFYGVNWNGIYTKRGMNHVIEDNYHTYIH